MIWIWSSRLDDPSMPFAEYDDENSPVDSSEVASEDVIDVSRGPARLRLGRRKQSLVYDIRILPAIAGCPLVDRMVAGRVSEICGDDVEFYPTVIASKSGPIEHFVFVRPKVRKPCTDLERSEITWLVENEHYAFFDQIYYHADCLGTHDIVREAYNERVVISDRLKTALEEFGKTGTLFIRPEDLLCELYGRGSVRR